MARQPQAVMRFTLTAIPGLFAAALLWREVVDCYPYKVTSPGINGTAHLALAVALVATLAVSSLAVISRGWAWPVLSGAAGAAGSLIPLSRAHDLAATIPVRADYEFNWHTSVLSLDNAVLVVFAITLFFGIALGAVMALPAVRR